MIKSRLKKILPSYLLLILLPCVFGLFLYFFIVNIDKRHEIEAIKSRLSERATDFMAKSTAVDYYRPYFNKLSVHLMPFIEHEAINGKFMTNKDVTQIINSLSEKLGDNVRCVIFNEKMEILNHHDLLLHERRFFTYAWKRIHGLIEYTYDERRIDQNEIIGDEFNTTPMVGLSEGCMPTVCPEKNCVFYFKNASKTTNGLIIFVEYKRTNQEIIQAKVKDFATYEQPIIFYDSEKKQRITSTLNHEEISYDKTNSDEFLNGFIKDDVVWKVYNAGDYKLLLGQTTDLTNKYNSKLNLGIVIFILLLSLFSYIFFRNFLYDKGVFISIRYKLIFIFAIAVYMPAFSLWILSYTSLHDHRIAIENKVKKGMLDILNEVDTNYKTKEEEIIKCYLELDQYIKSLQGKTLPSQLVFSNVVENIVRKNKLNRTEVFSWLDIRAIDKTQIFTTSTDVSNDRTKTVGRVLAMLGLEKYCPERLAYAGVKSSQSDILIGNLLENPAVGFAPIIERPKKLSFLNIDKSVGVYWWWNYYPEKDNPVAFVMGNAISRNVTVSYFNSLLKKRYSLGNTDIRLLNYHVETQRFIPEVKNSKRLIDLINVSSINKTLESAIINVDNNDYLCLCSPGSKIKDGYILGLYPIIEIDYQIEKVRSTIYTVMILLLIISILTGSLLAKTFITPVNELNRGLEALRKRETETVISIENKDELGRLGNAFNQMMGEIKDMLMAGAVQKCLIPTGKQNIEGYDCIIYNKMAADVGGDYADLFELPENKLLIVIGGVNGHGVSSSLLAAMVKASVFLFANQNLPLNEIVANTSRMICDLLGDKKQMKFCLVTLNKSTGELAICNAGNSYPFIKTIGKDSLRIPSKINLAMGISQVISDYSLETEELKDNETLFLYTDGLLKLQNDKNEEFGYDNLKQLFTDMQTNDSEETMNQLVNAIKAHHGEKVLTDDITFIILRRKPLQDV